jgi:hypothetical protein
MRCIVSIDRKQTPNRLNFIIHNAPHRRMHQAILRQYRKELWTAALASDIINPIDQHVELKVLFVDPLSPDLDNMLTALYQALDGKAGEGPTILTDDRLVCYVEMGYLFH